MCSANRRAVAHREVTPSTAVLADDAVPRSAPRPPRWVRVPWLAPKSVRNPLGAPIRFLSRLGMAAIYRRAWKTFPRFDLDGVTVLVAPAEAAVQQQVGSSAVEALRLIAVYDPRRYARLRRDIRAVLVWPATLGTVAHFDAASRFCVLNTDYVQTRSAMYVALLVVHEGTHARLRHLRFKRHSRRRIETVCMRQELHFTLRVPNATDVREQLLYRLRNIDEVLGDDRRWVRTASDELHRAGMPRLVVRLIAWLRGSTP